MSDPIANDFPEIARRLSELRCDTEDAAGEWWCVDCRRRLRAKRVALGFHSEARGGCECRVVSWCDCCRGAGWIDQTVGGEPQTPWCVCPDCGNPGGARRP